MCHSADDIVILTLSFHDVTINIADSINWDAYFRKHGHPQSAAFRLQYFRHPCVCDIIFR